MPVVSEDIPQILAPHNLHGDAVCEAITFIRPTAVKVQAAEERVPALRRNTNIRVAQQRPHGLRRRGTQAVARTVRQKLRQHFVARNDTIRRECRCESNYVLVEPVALICERNPLESVSEEPAHAFLLGVP